MRTLDRFVKIEFSTYSDIASVHLSLYNILERKCFFNRATEHRSQQGTLNLSPPQIYVNEASKMATCDLAQWKLP